ncbi:MAG: GrpB family protein [Kiritimatiellaeota bacterium]|nr:GrpB family protein [Kiritimatiellota bacterium]
MRKHTRKKVVVSPYDPQWQTEFERIKTELLRALGPLALAVEHVGSTSVAGLDAKPIIDLIVVMKDETLGAIIEKLAQAGYAHEGDLGITGRDAFKYANKPHLMRHHLYVCGEHSVELKRQLAFRDHLRTHPADKARYAAVKKNTAAQHPNDIEAYMRAKAPCVAEILEKCGMGKSE